MEGISHFVPVPYFGNTECVRLLQNMPGGLIHIVDDQARRQPKKNDHTMMEAFAKRWAATRRSRLELHMRKYIGDFDFNEDDYAE